MIRPSHESSNPLHSELRKEYEVGLVRLIRIEKRLGTTLERENDLVIAQKIAHRLSNIQMLLTLKNGERMDDDL